MDTLKTPSQSLYDASFELIGHHLSLDNTIPIELGCAEAVSYVLKELNYDIPDHGLPGTATFFDWLEKNFEEVEAYAVGAIIISVTGTGLPNTHGHTGICGHNAIMSNDSETGLWEPYWSLAGWNGYYRDKLGMKVHFFRPK